GEYTGHYTPANPKPVVRVRCVTHRRDPIVWGTTHGKPITDGHAICTVNRSAGIWYELNRLGLPGLQGVYCPEAAGAYFVTVVSIRQRYPGHGRHAGHAVYATPSGNYANKLVIVVDDDIDPSNMDEVWWAVATRFQPSRDSVVWEGGTGTPLDPSIPAGEKPLTSRMILDATRPYPLERGEEVVSLTPEVVERVKAKWGEYFPPDAR
ncbi:MAG: UbiD family decarboxylase domain-containing protein, partial [Nitrospinota bacterium]